MALSTSRVSLRAAVAVAVALCGATSCYNPSLTNGGFKCSSMYKEECPGGYTCRSDQHCWLIGTHLDLDASADQAADTKVDASTDAPAADAMVESRPACIVPPTSCTPAGGPGCDLMCQTGCPKCEQKCSVNTAGTPTCNPMLGTLIRQLGDSCTIDKAGSTGQSDSCAPGLVCVQASCGSSCFKFCQVDADCPGSECSRTLTGGAKFCDVPSIKTCNPVKALGDFNCPGMAQGCYVSATVADETRCDCPFAGQHLGEDCTVSRECLPGLVCADPNGQNHFVCEPACALTGPTSGCSPPSMCNAIKGSKLFGFCN